MRPRPLTHRTTRRLFVTATFALLASACASGGAAVPSSQRNVVTNEELVRAGDVSVYDALVQIRPNFLRSHSGASTATLPQPVQVYIGGMLMPGLDHLRQVMARGVREVTFLEPPQAIARFGGNNTGGALVVVLM